MKNFEFYSPTKNYFGIDREQEIGQILSERKVQKILIVIGRGSVKNSGLLDRVVNSLKEYKIEHFLLEGVRANPTFESVKQGIELVKKHDIKFILPIGGGSVIDVAKCIAVNYDNDGDIRDFNFHVRTPDHALPIGVILTISAAGSEMSNSCVIQDDDTGTKSGFNSDYVRPVFAIENPVLTVPVSKEQTAYGIVDILMHTLERYFNGSDEFQLADEFALGLIKNVIDVGLLCYEHPDNVEYRGRIMLASSLSHNGITSVGKGSLLFVHQLEHPVSGMYPNIAHGLGLAVLWPAWAKYYSRYDVEKFAKLGNRVFNLSLDNKEEAARITVTKFAEFFKALGMPSTLTEIGVRKEDIDVLVERVIRKGTRIIPHPKKDMDEEVVRAIYMSCL